LKFTITNNIISKLATWTIVLSCFSYPITAVIILKFGFPSGLTNIILKTIYSIISFSLLVLSLFKTKGKIPRVVIPLLLFFFFYSLRLLYDVSGRGILMGDYSSSYIYSYYFGATILPCIAIISAKSYININDVIKYSFLFLVIANLSLIIYGLGEGASGIMERFATRSNITLEEDIGSAKTFINPITIGLYGASLILFCISNAVIQEKRKLLNRIFSYGLISVGVINVLLGASRGPFLLAIFLIIVILFYYLHWKRKNFRIKLKLIFILLILILMVTFILIPIFERNDIILFQRIELFFENIGKGSKEYRGYAYASGIQDFLKSPLWGNQYLGTYDNYYPHNILLEILMSIGIIGGILFSIILFQLYQSGLFLWKNKNMNYNLPIFIIALLNIILSMTSGSIFMTPQLWIFIVLLTLIPKMHSPFPRKLSPTNKQP